MSVATFENRNHRNKIHPKMFSLLVACVSIFMMFAAFTSAYVVRQAAGNWLEFAMPKMFFYSAGVMILSSVLLHASYIFFKKGNAVLYRGLMAVAFVLGILFVYCQYQGWMQMLDMGIELTGNPSGSFVYVLSWVHAAHVIGGIGMLIVAMVHAFSLKYYVTPIRKMRFEMTLLYWHFVDFLWIYLLILFVSQQS